MKILIDTNILIDYIAEREPYFENAQKILLACSQDKINGAIAAHSISNMFYILRKQISEEERRKMLKALCTITTVIALDKNKLMSALDNSEFTDMEDCLQTECARAFHADYIVTRNIKDFQNSVVIPILPENFLKIIQC